MDQTIQTYNRVAKGYDEVNLSEDWYKKEFQIFRKLLPSGKIIDIGCGAGRDTVLFLKNGYGYVGIDASRSMLKLARKRNKKAKFLFADFYKLDFPKESFDGFWAAASLLHVPKRRILKVLKSIRSIMKPNALGFVSVRRKISAFKEGTLVEKKYGQLIKRYFTHYTRPELIKVLNDGGFRVVRIFQKENSHGEIISWLHAFVRKNSS